METSVQKTHLPTSTVKFLRPNETLPAVKPIQKTKRISNTSKPSKNSDQEDMSFLWMQLSGEHEFKKQLVKYLSFNDLKNLRLVSKTHKELFTPYMNLYFLANHKMIEIKDELQYGNYIWRKWEFSIRARINLDSQENIVHKNITSGNWSSSFASYFHKLELGDIWNENLSTRSNGIKLTTLITQLSPYITHLTLTKPPDKDLRRPREQLANFMKQFTNLNEVTVYHPQLTVGQKQNFYLQNAYEELEGFKILLKSLASSVTKRIFASQDHKEVLVSFSSLTNAKFVLIFEDTVVNFHQLEYITHLVLQYHMKDLQIDLKLNLSNNFLSRYQKPEWISSHLTQLSSSLTHLTINQKSMDEKLDVLKPISGCPRLRRISPKFASVPSSSWSKLIQLKIYGYQHPLEILKGCPNLEELDLDVDENACIFHNSKVPVQDNLKTYFSNLPHLKELLISSKQIETKFLKEFIPKDAQIVKYYRSS